MKDFERRENGKLYIPANEDSTTNHWNVIRKACKEFNDSNFWEDDSALKNLQNYFAQSYDDLVLTPPFYCDRGNYIYFGKHFYANTNLTILDEAPVRFGDNVFIGPNVGIYTAGHPIDAEVRAQDLEYALPIIVGNDVWIGGGVQITPGITVGDDVVIGAGAVITKDIPAHSIAAGVPCKVIRKITQKDREYWQKEYHDYKADSDIN